MSKTGRPSRYYGKSVGIEKPKLEKRKCLANTEINGQCTILFYPKHKWNFICPRCTKAFQRTGASDE